LRHADALPLTPLDVQDIMQGAGYGVMALPGQPVDASGFVARHELSFTVRFGKEATEGRPGLPDDVALFATLRLHGDLPLGVARCWSLSRRFVRVPRGRGFLAANIALIVVGGMTSGHAQVLIDICDRLTDEFLPDMKAAIKQRMATERTRRGRALSRLLVGGGATIIGGFTAADHRSQMEICDQLLDEVVPGLRIALNEFRLLGRSPGSPAAEPHAAPLLRQLPNGMDRKPTGGEGGVGNLCEPLARREITP
jgi:hypothetical protein